MSSSYLFGAKVPRGKARIFYFVASNYGPTDAIQLTKLQTRWSESKWCDNFLIFSRFIRRFCCHSVNQRNCIPDRHMDLRTLNAMQRKCRELFQQSNEIASSDIQALFNYKPRSTTALLSGWVSVGFLVITDPGLRTRKFGLSESFGHLLD